MSVVGVSAEDRFALLDMSSPDKLFPHPFAISGLSFTARQLGRRWDMIWDFRNGDYLYSDIVDAYRVATDFEDATPRTVLAKPSDRPRLEEIVATGTPVLSMHPRQLPIHELSLDPFYEGDMLGFVDYTALISPNADRYHDSVDDLGLGVSREEVQMHLESIREELPDDRPWDEEKVYEVINRERATLLDYYFSSIASNSLLSELLFLQEGERTRVVPYHSHSLHWVRSERDELVLMRPGRASARYWARFKADIDRLEALVNDPESLERDIERLLSENPLFLRGLNYQQVYTQVVLPEDAGRSKRVDVIAEPCTSEWTDLIELKRANEPVLVGRENRATLSAAIHSVVRQLREYRAYFDDRHMARRVEERYGFRCHQPRLAAIVGRDPSGWGEEEISRALTTYPDVRIITYDELLRAARSLLLL